MKIKLLLCLFICGSCLSVYAQNKRDTILIYDTIIIKAKRPSIQENFYKEDSATFSKDSINEDINTKMSSLMNAIKKQANQLIKFFALGSMATVSSITTPIFADTDTIQKADVYQESLITKQAELPKSIENSEQFVEIDIPSQTKDTLIETIIVQQEDSVKKKYFPIYLSVFHPAGIFGKKSDDYRYSFALSLFTGAVGGIDGMQIATIYNQVNGAMNGMQIGGILNITQQVRGIQIGGICNFNKDMKGIQVGGILNRNNKVDGIQVGGIMNASDDVKGLQVGGICNISDNMSGIQVGGISNISKDVRGLQVGGIYNKSENIEGLQVSFVNKAKNVKGVQTGFINKAKSLNGVQFGFINILDSLKGGVPIGFINIVKSDFYFEIEALYVSTNSLKLNFRFGSSLFHTIIGGGVYFAELPQNLIGEFTFGFGNNAHLVQNLYWQSSITGSLAHGGSVNSWSRKNTISTGLVYFIGDRVGIKVMPNIFVINDNYWDQNSNLKDNLYRRVIQNTHLYEWGWGFLGLGLELGVSIKI